MTKSFSLELPSQFSGSSGDESGGPSFDLKSLVGTVYRRFWLIVSGFLATFLLIAYVTFTATPIYKSSTTIQLAINKENVIDLGSVLNGIAPNTAEIDTEVEPSPLFASQVVRQGSDVTLVAYGPMVKTCLKVAEVADSEGRSVEVIDLRTLSPLDLHPVFESVRRTGRVVLTHEAHLTGGIGGEIAARVVEHCFYSLLAPPLRVAGLDTPYPPSRIEEEWLPDLDRVLDAIDRTFTY